MPSSEELYKLLKKPQGKSSSSSRPSSKSNRPLDKEASKLYGQVKRQQAKLHEKPHSSPSVLSRVFDVLSRGNYAVAEASRRGKESEHNGGFSPTEWGHGFVAGLTGKKKTTFSGYLKEVAKGDPKAAYTKIAKNKAVQGVGGLALDIVADPLNAVGAGIVTKGAEANEVVTKGARAFKAAQKANTTRSIAKKVQLEETVKAAARGLGNKEAKKVGQKAFKKTLTDAANVAKIDTEASALAKKGAIGLNVFGVPVAKSTKLYSAGSKVAEHIPTGAKAALSLRYHFPGKTLMFKRMAENAGVATWEDSVKSIRNVFGDLTKQEKMDISHWIEKGAPSEKLDTIKMSSGKSMAHYADQARDLMNHMFDVESELGLHTKIDKKTKKLIVQKNPNYVYHFYKGGSKEAKSAFKTGRKVLAVGTENPAFTEKRVLKTLEDAKKAGLKPVEAIDDILALRMAKHQQVLARKSFVAKVIDEYGIQTTKKEAKHLGLVPANSKFVPSNFHFPPDIAKTLGKLDEVQASDEATQAVLRLFDKVQGYWKLGATAVNPGHHVRNMAGDVFLNFEDGVTNPKHYADALRVLRRQGKYKIGKVTFTGDQLLREFIDSGARSGFYRTEFGKAGFGKPLEAVRSIAEHRENYTRMAHFLHALREEGSHVSSHVDLQKLAQKVTHERVNKFNFDYGALTPFEKNKMKRIVPFYTWARKNIPLQLEMLALKPGRIATIPKSINAIEQLMGTRNESSDIGGIETVPKWIREMSPIRLSGETKGHPATYMVPSMIPFTDPSSYTQGGQDSRISNLLSQLSPILRTPIELGQKKALYSGAPINNNAKYFSEQNPMTRLLYKRLHDTEGNLSFKDFPHVSGGQLSPTQLRNYLLGLGVYEVTPGMQKGELRRQQDIILAKLRKKREAKKHHRSHK